MPLAETARLHRTVVRFATVGVANTAIDLILFWVLAPSLGVLTANFLSTSAGMTFSFWMNGHHTFRSTTVTPRQALLFLATNGFTMWLLQPLLIGVAHGLAGVPLTASKVVALGGSVVANFLLYRYVVWRPSSGPRGTSAPRRERGLSEPTAELAKS